MGVVCEKFWQTCAARKNAENYSTKITQERFVIEMRKLPVQTTLGH